MTNNIKDLIIIGAGPAGFAASIYASRYGIKNLIIGNVPGGSAAEAHIVCNWPSEKEISGRALMDKMQDAALTIGGELIMDEVIAIKKQSGVFSLTTSGHKEITAKTVLVAIGTKHRTLGIAEEGRFFGRGVTYCATCDGPLFRNKVVAVVGGSDAANTNSLYLSAIAKKVYQIYRGEKLRGDVIWATQVTKNPKIEVIYNTNVIGLKGEKKLEKVILDHFYQGSQELALDGVFVEIGSEPHLEILTGTGVKTNDGGYIVVGPNQATSIEGIWAAGDITTNSNNFHQIITACAEGAVAAESIFKYIQINK